MESNSLPVEIVLSHPGSTLGYVQLDWQPQPGAYLDLAGQTYVVLERKHRYLLQSGRYRLHKVTLYVQKSEIPLDRRLFQDQWVIGDTSCLYNARSELLRCAVNPTGPCSRCLHYQPLVTD